ncbi:MerR family transcriptional regulator, partial [Vibrio fluvialis]|uniref:MerR family transcriptional regulator n=1 Tax=Vibrio fluvialis TaxID=676 RepID=UPI001EE9B330
MFQIGELAKRCGVSTDTLRFYEKNALISPAGRSDSGYRLYDEENQKQVSFILKAKELGLSLEEIKELLEIRLEADSAPLQCRRSTRFTPPKALFCLHFDAPPPPP